MNNIKNRSLTHIKLLIFLYIALNIAANIFHWTAMAEFIPVTVKGSFTIAMLLSYGPVVLFAVCVFRFAKSRRSYVFLLLSCATTVLMSLNSVISSIKTLKLFGFFDQFSAVIRKSSGIVVFIEAILSVITLILSTILLWTCLNGFKTLRVAKVSVVAKMCIAVFNVLFSPVLVFVGGNYYEKILSAQMLVYASALLINISYILFWFSITEENVATLTRRKNIHNEVVAETLHFCTNCGSKLTPSVYFCEQCGNQVRE